MNRIEIQTLREDIGRNRYYDDMKDCGGAESFYDLIWEIADFMAFKADDRKVQEYLTQRQDRVEDVINEYTWPGVARSLDTAAKIAIQSDYINEIMESLADIVTLLLLDRIEAEGTAAIVTSAEVIEAAENASQNDCLDMVMNRLTGTEDMD